MALLASQAGNDPVIRALVCEAAAVYAPLSAIKATFKRLERKMLAGKTPLVFLRSDLLADQAVHRQWLQLFQANITRHQPLPPPAAVGLSFPVEGVDGSDAPLPAEAHLKAIIDQHLPGREKYDKPRPPLATTIAHAHGAAQVTGNFRRNGDASPIFAEPLRAAAPMALSSPGEHRRTKLHGFQHSDILRSGTVPGGSPGVLPHGSGRAVLFLCQCGSSWYRGHSSPPTR